MSVVIPTHNSARFLGDAVDSVRAQTFDDYEIIVVDDGSTDDTAAVLGRFGGAIRRHWQPNQGAAAARNAGIGLATGQFVCFLDADDVWMPGRLACQIEFMRECPAAGLLFSDASEWQGDLVQKPSILATMCFGDDARSQVPIRDAFRKLLIENFIPTSTVMIPASCFEVAGRFDRTLPNAEDRDMWLRIAAYFPIACVPHVLARKRSHDANISSRTEHALRSRIRVWQQCRQRFPDRAPAAVYHEQLASAYQQLGSVLLERGESGEARACAVASLNCAIRASGRPRSAFHFRWCLSIALIAASLLRSGFLHRLVQVRDALRKTTRRAAV